MYNDKFMCVYYSQEYNIIIKWGESVLLPIILYYPCVTAVVTVHGLLPYHLIQAVTFHTYTTTIVVKGHELV